MTSLAWEETDEFPRSMSGVRLAGDQLARLVYLDEAGTAEGAPIVVVAGVIVNVDKQWKAVASHLRMLAEKYFPIGDLDEIIFHVKDIRNGKKQFHSLSPEERRALLEELALIPRVFRLPIVFGWMRKQSLLQLGDTQSEVEQIGYGLALAQCIVGVERYMREAAPSRELATLVAEDKNSVKNMAKSAHLTMRHPKMAAVVFPPFTPHLPVERIVDTVHYAKKQEATLLQVADTCAWIISRQVNGWKDGDHFFRILSGGLPMIHMPSETVPGAYDVIAHGPHRLMSIHVSSAERPS